MVLAETEKIFSKLALVPMPLSEALKEVGLSSKMFCLANSD